MTPGCPGRWIPSEVSVVLESRRLSPVSGFSPDHGATEGAPCSDGRVCGSSGLQGRSCLSAPPSSLGEGPGRFRGDLLLRSPPRPSAYAGALEVPTTGLRVLFEQDRANPPDLDAGFPVSSRVSTVQRSPAGHPLLGLSKDRPSIVPCRGVRHPDAVLPPRPSELGCRPPRVPPAWFLTTSADSPPRPCRFVSPCSRSWGSPRFPVSEDPVPRGAGPALRSLPSADSDEVVSVLVGSASRSNHHWLSLHRRALPPRPFPPLAGKMVSHRPRGVSPTHPRSRDLEALLHRRVRCLLVRFQSNSPGAPLGLTDTARSPSSFLLSEVPFRTARSAPLSRFGPTGSSCGPSPLSRFRPHGARPCRISFVRQRPLREAGSRSDRPVPRVSRRPCATPVPISANG